MNAGYVIAILFGGRVPYVLRAVGDSYRFLGDCYVPDLMNSEAVNTWKGAGSKTALFDLV
jgi:hypothetical protein